MFSGTQTGMTCREWTTLSRFVPPSKQATPYPIRFLFLPLSSFIPFPLPLSPNVDTGWLAGNRALRFLRQIQGGAGAGAGVQVDIGNNNILLNARVSWRGASGGEARRSVYRSVVSLFINANICPWNTCNCGVGRIPPPVRIAAVTAWVFEYSPCHVQRRL